MNILLIGGAGRFANKIIIKLKKEGHRVYVLTGDPYKKTKYEKVFERYDFLYDSDNIREIFESINPDVTICMGAYDTNYNWDEKEREAVRYTSGLMNILVSYSSLQRGKFIYLSSDEVYTGHYEQNITEDMPVSAAGLRGITLAQGERICESYQANWNLDLVVLRLDHLYSVPENSKDIDNICANMCMQALKYGYITVNSKEEISLLHEKDAIEFIYKVVRHKAHNQVIYNLSSSREHTVKELAEMIQKYMSSEVSLVEALDESGRHVLSNELFADEFGCQIMQDEESTIKEMVSHMEKHKAVFLYEEEEELTWLQKIKKKFGWFLKVCIPFVENLIMFIPFFMLNNRTVGNELFANIDLYLIYVLLFAIVYGQQQATVSAVLAVSGYLFRQMYQRSGFEVMLDYNTYVWIAQLFILGLIVGYMRDEIRIIRMESEELEEHLNLQLKDIRDINDSNVRVKDVLEQQVIDQKDSIGKIYSITSKLDQYMPDEVLFYAVEMLNGLLGSKDVAIYSVYDSGYARMFSASSDKARALGNSIRYREMVPMYEELKEHRVYINRSLDENYPLMANAIFENDRMQMIIMVWGIPWEKMTLAQANLLTVVSYLIQNAVLRANRYVAALEDERYHEGTEILEAEAFASLVRAYTNAKEKNLAECTLLQIDPKNEDYRTVATVLADNLRNTDYLGTLDDGGLYVLLANTSRGAAKKVVERFAQAGYESDIMEKY